MPIVTATEVTVFTDISCSAGTTTLSLLIPIVQERITLLTNNYFVTDMQLWGYFTYASAANTITSTSDFTEYGFRAADEIYIYNSYRNDGYKIIGSVTTTTITLATGHTCTEEISGATTLISVVSWPNALKYIAAHMIKFDYDDRPGIDPSVTSESLGPYSYTRTDSTQKSTPFGYPRMLIDALASYTVANIV